MRTAVDEVLLLGLTVIDRPSVGDYWSHVVGLWGGR